MGKPDNRNEQTDGDTAVKDRMSKISKKIIVLSGKGGVGKSTVSVNLAVSLAQEGKRVGLLDVDLHGPSIPTMLGIGSVEMKGDDNGIIPVEIPCINNLKVMSVGFLLQETDAPVIWRGPMKSNVIRQFLGETNWGKLDYLVVDCPPGTGDEPLSIIQMMGNPDIAVIVTTPQGVSSIDVSKSINFCRQLSLPVAGLIENMSGFVCPECGKLTEIFRSGGGRHLADKYSIPFLGSIPIDPAIGIACDSGVPFVQAGGQSPTASIFNSIARDIIGAGTPQKITSSNRSKTNKTGEETRMKIAIPTADGKLNLHFGHCDNFRIFEVDEKTNQIISASDLTPPPHEPGLLPVFLGERGINLVIAGGMGGRARQLFEERGIKVITGAPSAEAEKLVTEYFAGTLITGANTCDH